MLPDKDASELQEQLEKERAGRCLLYFLLSLLVVFYIRDFNNYISIPVCITEKPGELDPPLSQFYKMDVDELGEGSTKTVIQHLKEIKAEAIKEFGHENVLPEDEAREIMIGVSFNYSWSSSF